VTDNRRHILENFSATCYPIHFMYVQYSDHTLLSDTITTVDQ